MKTVTYAELLDLYQKDGNLFLCYALSNSSNGYFDTKAFLHVLGEDACGPRLGKWIFRFMTGFFSANVLEDMYPGLKFILRLPKPSKEVKAMHSTRRAFRIAVMSALAKKCPERTFPYPEYV